MENSKIEWTDNTWNVAVGCDKVSEGCKYCYMMRDMGGVHKMDVDGTVTRTSKKIFFKPLEWQKQARAEGKKIKVFVSSLTDFFHPSIDSYRHEAWEIMAKCPDLIFQILTKRPERIEANLPEDWVDAAGQVNYRNVWLGTTIENQKRVVERVPTLLSIPAICHFVSVEPILSKVVLNDVKVKVFGSEVSVNFLAEDCILGSRIDWVIVGGESGNEDGDWKYREANISWFDSIIEQCQQNAVSVFVKQLGTFLAKTYKADRHGKNIDNAFPMYRNNVFGLSVSEILRQFPRLK